MTTTEHRSVLSASTRDDVRAFAEAVFARHDGPPPQERLRWLVEDVDDFVAHLNTRSYLLFRLCLFVVTWVAPLLLLRFTRLASLPQDRRLQALEALERSPAALALFGARAIVSLVYYEHPDAAREIGWDQKCLTVVRREAAATADASTTGSNETATVSA